ncbi:hypothetical protein AGR6A_pTi0005 [Agrobacterium sp. NCPPB 925]|nr:hypothetical protein AGR6A_pTi0005 [Agrobacterium sp. NCPPB 925]
MQFVQRELVRVSQVSVERLVFDDVSGGKAWDHLRRDLAEFNANRDAVHGALPLDRDDRVPNGYAELGGYGLVCDLAFEKEQLRAGDVARFLNNVGNAVGHVVADWPVKKAIGKICPARSAALQHAALDETVNRLSHRHPTGSKFLG